MFCFVFYLPAVSVTATEFLSEVISWSGKAAVCPAVTQGLSGHVACGLWLELNTLEQLVGSGGSRRGRCLQSVTC